MSHLPGHDSDVPFRFVEHQEPEERADTDGRDMIGGLGAIREYDYWGNDDDTRAWHAEMAKREAARKRLKGGFGFH